MSLSGQSRRYLGVGLGHSVAIDHATDVTRVAWHLLLANVVGWARDPILRVFAAVAEDVLVHLSARRQVHLALHALLEGNATHIGFVATAVNNLAIDGACSLAEELILERDVACVAWKILTTPEARLLRSVFRRLSTRLIISALHFDRELLVDRSFHS